MKYQTKRLSICIALVLLCAFVLPLFGGCAKDEKKPAAEEVVEKVPEKDKETEEKKPQQNVPAVTKSDPNAPSLQSTPNKGGSYQATSGSQPVKSAYTTYLEEQAKLTAEILQADKDRTVIARRNLAEATFRTMLTLRWTPKESFEYKADQTYKINAGTTYYGLPFSHGAQSLATHMLFQDSVKDDGTLVMNFSKNFFDGGSGTSRLGFNNEDGLVQAWCMVSESVFASLFKDFVPEYGFLLVGDLKLPKIGAENDGDPGRDFTETGKTNTEGDGGADVFYDNLITDDTPLICKENGEQGMYEAYALLQKADGLIKNGGGTDAMMVVSVSVVRNADGTVNGDESKVTILKQTPDFNAEKSTFAEVDKEYSFKELFTKSYIPMTVAELNDGTPLTELKFRDSLADRQKQDNLVAGTFTTNRRVAYMTNQVFDADGNEILNATHLATQSDIRATETERRYCFEVQKITSTNETGRFLGTTTLPHKLPYESGKIYRNLMTLYMVTGESIVVRDFTFVAK